MWATRFGIPALQFGLLKLRTKQPALSYVLQETFALLDGVIEDNVRMIDPDVFAQTKKYVMLVMRRA